jgi:hypothetical protein
MKASLRLAKTVPASLNGAAAALRYVRERYDVGQYLMYEEDGYRLLLFSTERAICAAAGLAVPDRGRRSAMTVRAPKRRDHVAVVSARPVLGRRLLATKRKVPHHRFCAAGLATPAARSACAAKSGVTAPARAARHRPSAP